MSYLLKEKLRFAEYETFQKRGGSTGTRSVEHEK